RDEERAEAADARKVGGRRLPDDHSDLLAPRLFMPVFRPLLRAGGLRVESEGRGQGPIGLGLCSQAGGHLLRGGDRIGAGDEAAWRRLLARDGDERPRELGGVADRAPVPPGGDDGVAGGQGGLGEIDAHATTGAGDEPDLLAAHDLFLPFFPKRSIRYAILGPSSPSYASWAMAIVKGSRYRAIRSGPASTGSKPTSRTRRAATPFASWSSPQYRRLGRRRRRRFVAKTSNSTSLGTVPNADTTLALRTFLARASAPDDVRATTSRLSSALIGSAQVTITLPATAPACFNTSSTRDQCTARSSASAFDAASRGVPALARPRASRASRCSFRGLCE